MRILSIDASTKATGVAILQDNELIYYNCITDNNHTTFQRIAHMQQEIENIYIKYKPDKIVMEEVLPKDVKNNQSVYKALIYLQAYIVICLYLKFKKEIQFYVSAHWRKLCGIKTGAGIKRDQLKKASIQLVKNKYNINVNDDISDAICIGIAYLQQHRSAF